MSKLPPFNFLPLCEDELRTSGRTKMGYLKQIEIENFKSWRGRRIIGPLMRFSCIIGTNGSGKSNLMDALSFAMGERSSTLRVKQLRDLIHGAHIGQPVSDSASVAIRYRGDAEQEVVFCRRIIGNSSEYFINNVKFTLAKYLEQLEMVGIVSKAQNCLVFQGTVETIALKEPKERTKMFESISQSKELAAEYIRRKEALLKAKEDTQFHFNKKKSASVERKQMFKDKVEAQRYQALLDELQDKHLQLKLAELHQNERAVSVLSGTLREKQQAAGEKNDELLSEEQALKTCKKEHGRLNREQQHLEKEIRAQEHVHSQSNAQYIKAKVNSSHLTKKMELARDALKKAEKTSVTKEQELVERKQQMEELKRSWRNYEKKAREEGVSRERHIELDEDQLKQYRDLKELVHQQGAGLSQQAEKMNWEVRSDHEKIVFDQRRKKELEAALRSNQAQLDDLISRAEKLEEYAKNCSSTLDESRRQEESLSVELERGRQRSEKVAQELSQVLEELRNARLDNHESKRQLQRKELLEKLSRLYPEAVYGRLADLCSPIHKKYQLAVTKVFGRYMNAIVVSSEKVARECISFIKNERAEPETFLPIDYLDVSPLNERLRTVPGAKMLVDVVQISAAVGVNQLRKAVHFVCGNTLVCESIKDAKSVAFDRPERHKTVSLDGTLFSKSGVISGGSSDLRNKARCWDEKAVVQLKERKDQLTAELQDLLRLRRKESDLKQIVAQAQGAKTRLKYAKADLDNITKKNLVHYRAEISRLESEKANLDYQIQMQQECVELKDAEMKKTREQIEQIERSVFADFCAEIGVETIREYEQEYLKQQTELDKKQLEFESHRTRLNAQLEYEQKQLDQQKIKRSKMEETTKKTEAMMAEHKEGEKKLLLDVEEAQDKLAALKNQLLLKTSQVADAKAELDHKSRSIQKINKDFVKLQREVMSAETALEQKRMARHNLLLACKIQGLPITLLSGNLNDISEMDTETESTLGTLDLYEREALLIVDYSSLAAELRSVQTEQEAEACLHRLREALASVEDVLYHTTAPNMKALEKVREVKDKFQGVAEAFDASTRVVRKCSQEFEQVKFQRCQRFNKCFEHVSVVIDQIYKRLCRNSSAQAILSADNPDEPFLGGINYCCVAPGKRFTSMDNLSGGEKAIAALALLFAIHSFCPAPFFILDEVDAALDNSNIGKVTSFLQDESSSNMQIIVISLKEEFFSKADALLGVYSVYEDCMVSHILTLDLRPYPLAEEAREKQAHVERVRPV
ncbi:structural maintenance of chromosomes 1B isoform X2 [Takifugu rubripes]|uniref:structural maintenance of chromosomes 1B isoform X2 n=1 Tax=Takifugu rubripes TaxID=31033 RepID=UPI001145274E|nr:SMC1 beta protein isoform X2 [Takifugu rubripes]